ncbi:MAG: response regulator [Acetobacteraceae bacterium]
MITPLDQRWRSNVRWGRAVAESGWSARVLCVIAFSVAPMVAAQMLATYGVLSPALGISFSIPVSLMLASLAGRSLLIRPLRTLTLDRDDLEQTLSRREADAARREKQQQRQSAELEAVIAERTKMLSEYANRLHVALNENTTTASARGWAERQRLAGQLVGAVAHDFNNLLATVLGCLELMDRRLDDAARMRTLILRATDAAERAARLSSGFAHFSHCPPRAPRLTDVSALVTELQPMIVSALGRRIQLVIDLVPGFEPVHMDPAELETTLLAICMAARGILIEGGQVALTAHSEAVGDSAVSETWPSKLSVTIVSDAARTTSGDLASVLGVAAAAGGTFHVSTGYTTGRAEVSISLCRDPVPQLRVLLVDENDAARRVTRAMLQDFGCTVFEAPSGPEAIASLGPVHATDLLILDYGQVEADYLELTRIVGERGMKAPIVIATGYPHPEAQFKTKPIVSDVILPKPFSARQLQTAIAGIRRSALPDTCEEFRSVSGPFTR